MNEINTVELLIAALDKETIGPPDTMTPSYGALYFDCGCGESHILEETHHFLCAIPIKFFFLCDNNVVTLVRVKGMIFQKSVEEWFCDGKLFEEAMEQVEE